MDNNYNLKYNLSLTGTTVTDELHSDVGASAFTLIHDWFIDDDTSGDNIVIRTAASGGGTLLIKNTDYSISNKDDYLSGVDVCNKEIWSTITIINASYQTGALYFSYKAVADSIEASDINQITPQYSALTTSTTLSPVGFMVYGCTAGVNGIRQTLPSATTCKNIELTFKKLDDTMSAVTIWPNGAETIDSKAFFLLLWKHQKIKIKSDGTNWIILEGERCFDTGFVVSGGDYTNVKLGMSVFNYNNLSGTFLIGETIKEATSNNTGVIFFDNGLQFWVQMCYSPNIPGTPGTWTTTRVITGLQSGATCQVNGTFTGGVNNDVNHNLDRHIHELDCRAYNYITNNDESTCSLLAPLTLTTDPYGATFLGASVDAITLRLATSGTFIMASDGSRTVLTNQNYFYRIKVSYKI